MLTPIGALMGYHCGNPRDPQIVIVPHVRGAYCTHAL